MNQARVAIIVAFVFLVSVLAGVLARKSSAQPQMPSGRDVLSANAYDSVEPVARGHAFQIAVVLKIRPGFHVNARQPSADYLIPTDLRANLPAGFKGGEVAYPKGELRAFTFSKTPLNVYEDKVILRMSLNTLADAPLGEQHIPLKLRYQACSNEVCLPPVTVDVDAVITVASSAEHSHANHPELFQLP